VAVGSGSGRWSAAIQSPITNHYQPITHPLFLRDSVVKMSAAGPQPSSHQSPITNLNPAP